MGDRLIFSPASPTPAPDFSLDQVLVLIPVMNEAATIGNVVRDLRSRGLSQIRVVDNGSRDRSVEIAEAAGAEVLREPIPGYGRACWRGLQAIPPPHSMDFVL